MCYYITAVLAAGTSLAIAQSVAERHARNLKPLENLSIQSQLNRGEQYFLTTAGHCDCDTSLGLLTRKRPPHQSPGDKKAKKLAAAGWSSAKIERALSQSARSQERSSDRAKQLANADSEAWIAFIEGMRAAGAPYIGILLHFYNGALSEDIQLKERIVVRSAARAREILPRITEDTLYEFRLEA